MDTLHRVVPEPSALLRDVTAQDAATRLRALGAVGVPGEFRKMSPGENPEMTRVTQAQLLFANLDADPDLEAIIVLQQLNYAWAAVFDRRVKAWQRVAFFGCWCKYEHDPLARFLELRSLVEPGRNEIIVRDSLGGTGSYWRDVVVCRMIGGAPREILRIPEERRECDPTGPRKRSCSEERAVMSSVWDPHLQAVIVLRERGEVPIPAPVPETRPGPPQWYPPLGDVLHNPKLAYCRAYSWNAHSQIFAPDQSASRIYCAR